MVISRNLSLTMKLNGYANIKRQFKSLITDATKLQSILAGMTFNISGMASSSNIQTPLDNVVKKTKAQVNELASINRRASKAFNDYRNDPVSAAFLQDFSGYTKNIRNVRNLDKLSNTVPTFAVQAENKVLDLKNKELQVINRSATQYNNIYRDRINNINRVYSTETTNLNKLAQDARALVQTGFGLHIVQIYLAPILYALEQISAKMISIYSEFDKTFTNYMVKSEEYGEWLSKSDFYNSSVGQTYGIIDATIAAERFAASGVDVAKSQQALTSVMQVATVAQMDYTDAANGVIQTMQAMHMQVSEVNVITDALINSANASTAELKDLVQWFEYAASSAYQAGLSVNELAAYLGILSSTGTPNTGAAMRQLFLQLSKEDIQSSLEGAFSWITPKDFSNIDELILKMRSYVKSQTDEKTAVLSITRLLGGKANAQQALNNLIMAEPELWNQVTNAVNKTGSTQELYNKVTNNAADAIERIKVNLDIWFAQLGEVVGPILKIVSDGFTKLTEAFVSLPSFVKKVIGASIILITVFIALSFAAIGIIGAIAIMTGTLWQLYKNEGLIIFVTKNWSMMLKELIAELYRVVFASTSAGSSIKNVTVNTMSANSATKALTISHASLNAAMWGATGAMLGYATSSSAMQKHMYSEAYMVGHLTSLWIAYSTAKAASFLGPGAIVAGVAAGAAYETLMYDQIETMKRDVRLEGLANKLNGQTTKNYNINAENITLSADGTGIEDWLDALEVDEE